MTGSTDGLLLRVTDREDHDKLMTVLTPDRGRICLIAKGSRSVHSRLLALTQPFTYANFEFYDKNGGIGWLRGGAAIETFSGIRGDLDRLSLASYLAEVCCDVTGENVPAADILRLTLNSYYALSSALRPLWIVKGVFELRSAGFSGFMPDLHGCHRCGAVSAENLYLDVMNGRLICGACLQKAGGYPRVPMDEVQAAELSLLLPISPSVAAACRYILHARPERMYAFHLDDTEKQNFADICENYLLHHLERDFDSLKFYRELDPDNLKNEKKDEYAIYGKNSENSGI